MEQAMRVLQVIGSMNRGGAELKSWGIENG